MVNSELVPLMDKAVSRLGKKDYSNETVELLNEIDQKSVC